MCRPDLGLFLYICLNMFALMYLHSCLLIGYGKLKLILICFLHISTQIFKSILQLDVQSFHVNSRPFDIFQIDLCFFYVFLLFS